MFNKLKRGIFFLPLKGAYSIMNYISLDCEKAPAPFDENYFRTHTYGIEDKYYIACGLEEELPLWKSQETSVKHTAFNKKAFFDPGRFFLKRGVSRPAIVYYILLILVFNIIMLFPAFSALDDAASVQELEEPRYTYAEAMSMRDSMLGNEIDGYPIIFLITNDSGDSDFNTAKNKYLDIVKSDEYKQLNEYAKQAAEYERAASNSERKIYFKLKVLPIVLYFFLLATANFVTSLFADHIYSQWARKQILCIMADFENGEMSEKHFLALAERHYRKQFEKALDTKDFFDSLKG